MKICFFIFSKYSFNVKRKQCMMIWGNLTCWPVRWTLLHPQSIRAIVYLQNQYVLSSLKTSQNNIIHISEYPSVDKHFPVILFYKLYTYLLVGSIHIIFTSPYPFLYKSFIDDDVYFMWFGIFSFSY